MPTRKQLEEAIGAANDWTEDELQANCQWAEQLVEDLNEMRTVMAKRAGRITLPTCIEFLLSWPGQTWQEWHQDGCNEFFLTGIFYLQDGSKPTLFAPVTHIHFRINFVRWQVQGANYRHMLEGGDKQAEKGMGMLQSAWNSVSETRAPTPATSRRGKRYAAKKPRVVPSDNLHSIYGSQEQVDEVLAVRNAGDFQLEHPMHVHRAPPPPHSGSGTYRRVIFVAWDSHRVANASLTTCFHDTWRALWSDDSLIEADKVRARKRFKPAKVPKL